MTADPLACCAHCGEDRAEHHGGHDEPCVRCHDPLEVADPLADVLKSRAEPGWMADLGLLGDHVWEEAACAARDHIAAEIEAACQALSPARCKHEDCEYERGVYLDAARIARGETQ